MKKITISYFGVNEKTGKNAMTLTRMGMQNIEVIDVSVSVKNTTMDKDEDLHGMAIIKRLLNKLRSLPRLVTHASAIKKSDLIFVGYPGHLDLPIAWLAAKIFNKPLVFDQSTFLVDTLADDVGILGKASLLSKILFLYEKFSYSLPDLILVDTESIKTYLHTSFGVNKANIEVVYLGADENVYSFKEIKKDAKKPLTILYYGLYNPIHGVRYIVEAANILKKNTDIEFIMVGSGRLFPETKGLAEQYSLKNITFYPSMPEKDVQHILAQADVFLGFMQYSSSVDMFIPNKVAQGLALGKAVITADSKSIRSILTHKENVYLIQPGEPASIANAILELQKDRDFMRKIAMNGYEIFCEKLSMKAVSQKLYQVLLKKVK